MIEAARLRGLMTERQLSQSELARRVGVTQTTIRKLTSGEGYGSKFLHLIARELGTTPAYLSGETDDPAADAPLPPATPSLQFLTMPVALPTEDALADAFEGLLLASPRMAGAELARELAKRLPTLIRVAGGALAVQASAGPAALHGGEEAPDGDRRERQRA